MLKKKHLRKVNIKKKVDGNEAMKPDEERALLDKLPGETTQPHVESSRKLTRIAETKQASENKGPISSRFRPRSKSS